MSANAQRIFGRRSIGVAAAGGIGIFVVVFVQTLITSLISTLGYYPIFGSTPFVAAILAQHLWVALPFGVGVFISLWRIAPIRKRLHLMQVMMRSLLAAGAGAVCTLTVTTILGVFGAVGFSGSLFANSFPEARFKRHGSMVATRYSGC